MRISSLQIFNIANNSMADASEAIVKTQRQLSSGQRVLEPSDDPVASTKILSITEEMAGIKQYGNNINIAKNDLVIEETVLDGVLNVIQRIQELSVQAGNTATLSTSEYTSLANEVDSRLDELQNLLNTQNSSGDYIFGGYKSRTEPFSGSASTGYQYNGDEGQKFIKVANNTFVPSSDSGKKLFLDVESARPTISTYASPSNRQDPSVSISVGEIVDQEAFEAFYPEDMMISFDASNYTITERSTGRIVQASTPYTPGEELVVNGVSVQMTGSPAAGDRVFIDSSDKQDVLSTLARFSSAMREYDGSPERRQILDDTVADTLGNLKNAQTSVLEVTSKIGARFNTLESTEQLHFDSDLVLQQLLSELRDIDYAEASTRLSSQTLILQAAQASFSRVSRLSLFDQI